MSGQCQQKEWPSEPSLTAKPVGPLYTLLVSEIPKGREVFLSTASTVLSTVFDTLEVLQHLIA